MKQYLFFLCALAFTAGCGPDTPPLPPDAIQIDGNDWNYSDKNGLVRFGWEEPQRTIFLKFDGIDGSNLYLQLPTQSDSVVGGHPDIVKERVYYFADASINSRRYEGDAAITLLQFDRINSVCSLRFSATLTGDGQTLEVQSGDIADIPFHVIDYPYPTVFTVQDDQENWSYSESGIDFWRGLTDWAFYANQITGPDGTTTQDAQYLFLRIPFGLLPGTYSIAASDSTVFRYATAGNTNADWIFESGQLILEENKFFEGKQKGTFEAIFHNPYATNQKKTFHTGHFETNFAQ